MVEHAFIVEVLLVVASYLGVFIFAIVGINWLLGGLFKPYIKVKGSRGKLVLVKVKNIVGDYFVTGTIDERMLVFKDRKKEVHKLTIPTPKTGIYRSMNVSCIDVDDEKNAVITYDNELVTGFDAIKWNDLYTRALYKPNLVDNKTLIMIFLLIIILIGVGVVGFLTFKNGEVLKGIVELTKSTVTTLPK